MRLARLAALFLLSPMHAVAAVSGDQYVNVSGPAILQSIGPHNPRIDNPVFALLTAGVVAMVIYRGLKVHDRDQLLLSTDRFIIRIKQIEEEAADIVRHALERGKPR